MVRKGNAHIVQTSFNTPCIVQTLEENTLPKSARRGCGGSEGNSDGG